MFSFVDDFDNKILVVPSAHQLIYTQFVKSLSGEFKQITLFKRL